MDITYLRSGVIQLELWLIFEINPLPFNQNLRPAVVAWPDVSFIRFSVLPCYFLCLDTKKVTKEKSRQTRSLRLPLSGTSCFALPAPPSVRLCSVY